MHVLAVANHPRIGPREEVELFADGQAMRESYEREIAAPAHPLVAEALAVAVAVAKATAAPGEAIALASSSYIVHTPLQLPAGETSALHRQRDWLLTLPENEEREGLMRLIDRLLRDCETAGARGAPAHAGEEDTAPRPHEQGAAQ